MEKIMRNIVLLLLLSLSLVSKAQIFIDDDEIADKNWLINHIEFYDNFENI